MPDGRSPEAEGRSTDLSLPDIELVPGETVEGALALRSGLNDDFERQKSFLFLTSDRLIRWSGSRHRSRTWMVDADGVRSIQIQQRARGPFRLWAVLGLTTLGVFFGLLSLSTSAFLPMALTAMALAFWSFKISSDAWNTDHALLLTTEFKEMRCNVAPQSLDDLPSFMRQLRAQMREPRAFSGAWPTPEAVPTATSAD